MGFRYDEGALAAIVRDLRSGVEQLDLLANNMPQAVDAGFSSDVVNAALARVAKASVALAQVGEDIASKVDAAEGSYADIENTNEGQMRYQERYLEPWERGEPHTTDERNREIQRERYRESSSPLEHAPAETDERYEPDPVPASPSPTPEPPPPSVPTG
ncbi:MAG: hypothetical protein ACRDSE_06390 [Pseudonocardiaceae bacterium]